MANTSDQSTRAEVNRYQKLPKFLKVVCVVLFTVGIGLSVFYLFGFTIQGQVLLTQMYYYLLYACFASTVFLIMPLRRTERHMTKIPWYDLVLAAVVFGSCIYFATQAWDISRTNWAPPPTMTATVLASIMFLVALETGRRIAGLPLLIICVIFGGYVLFAEHMPGVLFGKSFSLTQLIGFFTYGGDGILGLPGRIIGTLLIGFLIFAGMLIAMGGGKFFINFALAALGRFRGGPAKVAVVASGFFGSLTGSPMTNVIGTGSFTIPAMKRTGYPAHYAGAIEAAASTGGMIMPPIMATIAFIMADFVGVPYATVIVAAFIPALLYYWGLLVQVDAYAARTGLKGLPREELPSLWKVLKEGWIYIVVLAFLVVGLIYFRWGAKAPFYATGLMFLLSFTSRETMMMPKKFIATLATMGNLITFIIGIMLPIGLLMIGISKPGWLTALVAEIINLTGSTDIAVVLLIAVAVSYVFGMVGLAIVPYIVLAATVVPQLVAATGLDLLALHLFLFCYLIVAGITPPVATTAFVAAGLAGSPPMKTAWTASRLAIVVYFIPFFFVFNEALVIRGDSVWQIGYLLPLCLVGIAILSGGLEGYLVKVGRLDWWARVPLILGGFLIAFPGYGQILTWWMTSIVGAGITALVIVIMQIRKKPASVDLITDL